MNRAVGRSRAYSREEKKRLIIHVFAAAIRMNDFNDKTAAEIARGLNITASTKLREILWEMTDAGLLLFRDEADASLYGYRTYFGLNLDNEAYFGAHSNARAERIARTIRLNNAAELEVFW